MLQMLTRDPADGATASGLLRAEHFQMAYVTNDIDRACDLFGKRLGICEWASLGGPTPDGGEVQARFAWVGTLMYEIICGSGPGSEIFMDRLPQTPGFALRHHHLGFLIHNQQQWDGVLANAAQHGWAIPHQGSNPLTQVCFVDVPELGHYLEYLYATPVGLEFFASVPRS
jgi:hypothetical protein